MRRLIIDCFTDESGQDTQGKLFVVCTIIVSSEDTQLLSELLATIENESGKKKKWYDTGNKRRGKYIELLLKEKLFKQTEVFYSKYQNKKDYIPLVGSHIAKAVLSYVNDKNYLSKIFIDRMDKKTINNLRREIKSFHIKYRKIRGITDESHPLIRLADSVCGMIRDLDNKNCPEIYKRFFEKIKEV